ncbi:KH domain-containing protein [Lentilactobacillus kribbianus]|uniref:KH domain-containing protein n=1 Tax=Lentilactobacillus kribbianus TaxID=2729622 RepID=UPI001557F115|nr:KH domain-containing protein [Lentilactobacillus kribbianus]
MVSIDNLIKTIISPLVEFPEEISVSRQSTERFEEYHVQLAADDIGRVIGRQGHVIQTIRTIVYSLPVQAGNRVRLVVDDNKQ